MEPTRMDEIADLHSLECSVVSGTTITETDAVSSAVPSSSTNATLFRSTGVVGTFNDVYRCNCELDGTAGLDGSVDMPVSPPIVRRYGPGISLPSSGGQGKTR